MLAESQKMAGLYKDAIKSYDSAMKTSRDPNLYFIVANLYDDKLNDAPNAIKYYEMYLERVKNNVSLLNSDYGKSIKKRLDYLKEKQNKVVR